MKTIILSIKPRWATKIYSREKRIELRRVIPKCIYLVNDDDENEFVKVLLYESAPVSKVTGECLMCVSAFSPSGKFSSEVLKKGCVTEQEMASYSRGRPVYALGVSGSEKWDVPKDISFYKKRPPMNFVYQLLCDCGEPYDADKGPCHVRCKGCGRIVRRFEVNESGKCEMCTWDCTMDD